MSYQYIDTTGVILADTSDILATVQQEYQTTFGQDLIVTSDTPQGVLIVQETEARANVQNNNAAVANQINPNNAGGVFLDAICAFLGLSRSAATFTLVPGVLLSGVANTLIPAGVQASTAAGDVFQSVGAVTLSSGGTANVNFQALVAGPVPCAIGALTNISPSTAVLGWETISNATAGTPGALQQSDVSLRQARVNTLAEQGSTMVQNISSSLFSVSGVTSAIVLENYYNIPMGMLIKVSGGTTLTGSTWAMSTTGSIIVDTSAMNFITSLQSVPAALINPWPIAAFSTTGNVSLSGLSTQAGGDWPGSLTAGQIILAKNQATASQNGLWVAESGAWIRHAYNVSGATISGSNEGIQLIPHSVWACVQGGLNSDIASALLNSKSGGCGWNGATSVSVVEPVSGQTYGVLFDRPSLVQVATIATLSQGTNTSNLTATALQAMIDFTSGNIAGEAGWSIGANASPYDLGAAIVTEQPGTKIREIQLAPISAFTYTNLEIPIALNQQAIFDQSYVTINLI
jgi:hypothetical protein